MCYWLSHPTYLLRIWTLDVILNTRCRIIFYTCINYFNSIIAYTIIIYAYCIYIIYIYINDIIGISITSLRYIIISILFSVAIRY